MKPPFLLFFAIGLLLLSSRELSAQSYSYVYTTTSVPRYNTTPVPGPPYRHYEDIRRYNAAPNQCAYSHAVSKRHISAYQPSCACKTPPRKIRTEVVSRQCQSSYFYDECGRRCCRKMTVTIYKDIYSDGGCRIWQDVTY